jgi:hypothetical protein
LDRELLVVMDFGTNPYDVAFLGLAPALALASLPLKRRPVVFAVMTITALVGWGLAFASAAWVDRQWIALLERTPDPSLELVEQFNADGASKSALVLFGLPYSFAYSAAWLGLVRGAQRLLQRRPHRVA